MKRFVRRLAAAGAASMLFVTPVMAAPSVNELKEQKQAAQGEVNSLQNKLTNIVEKISKLEEDLIAKAEEIEKTEKDLAAAEETEKKQYEDMKLRIKFMYESGDTSMLESLVTSKDFTELMNKAEYVQNVHSYDRKKLDEYIATKKKVKKLKTNLEKEQKEMQSKQTEYESEEDNLNMMLTSKEAELANIDGELQEAIEAAARAAAEAEARERAEREAAEAQQNEQQNDTNDTSDTNDTQETNEEKDTEVKEESNQESSSSEPQGSVNAGSVVGRAQSKLGCPYKWGACGPDSFDCSGFVSYCLTGSYSRIGTSGSMAGWPRVSNPQPGDVCVRPGHVGIYIGGGQMIHAPHTGDVVKVSPVQSGMWYVRY